VGEPVAVACENLWPGWRRAQPNFCERRWLLPSPSGRGNEGEGESIGIPKAALAVGANGLFIETHPKPDVALSDGPNMIPLGEMAPVLRSLLKIYEAAK
jgi:2-dehydro-3-deoxyphosphooctonate aldolase (KDO 8-P synthase)